MAIAGHDAPVDAVAPRRQRRDFDGQDTVIGGIDAAGPRVHTPLVRALHADRAEHGLDLSVEPDADHRRRRAQRGADARLGVVRKGVGPRRAGHCGQRGAGEPAYRGCVGPSTP